MISHPSPNFDDRPAAATVKYLILHYTGMATGQAALDRLCDPAAKVSAHYLIEEDGRVFSLVAEHKRAWHAGVSSWAGERDINGLSIGIELVNPGHDEPGYKGDYRSFPKEQMTALGNLCKDILSRHDILPWHILGHSDVAPMRKCDPGELFDWRSLASEGIGLWPERNDPSLGQDWQDISVVQQNLAEFGYDIKVTGKLDSQTRAVLSAFQQHFRPADTAGKSDQECLAILEELRKTH
ncbi:FIG001385: N-acetylmuramoyl-L-alanine amidase [hydrothermal vent metagenome]|uniref:N-acetylmuramoyl-L-alanine amidase n=1 Tax=hydrothermal vent metagenome TaxID=652676 RepID=A0A3B0RWW8_9ZZZZ